MRIFIDIDGVLAFCNVPVLAQVCNDAWKLGVSHERLAQIKRLEAFTTLPEVEARCSQIGAMHFEHELAWMYFAREVLDADVVATGAVEGVRRLAQLGSVAYLTARFIAGDGDRQARIAAATRHWLMRYHFVNPTNVNFCDKIAGKLGYLLDQARTTDELLVLIDDSAKRIVELIDGLDDYDRALLCERLILVAFAQTRPHHESLRTLRMPHWNVEPVARCLQEEQGSYDAAKMRGAQRSA